jgi:hypothetical protein
MQVRVFLKRMANWRLFSASLLLALSLSLLATSGNSAIAKASATSTASVTSSYGITMTPSSTRLQALPGGSASSQFTVINEGNTGYNIDLSTEPYYAVGDNYLPKFTLLPGKTNASAWIRLKEQNAIYLPAHKTQSISYALSVPAGVAPGGYYAVIFAETEPTTPNNEGIITHNRVGDILYITVEGPVTKKGTIVSTGLPRFEFGDSLPISLLVQNSGGIYFLADVNVSSQGIGHKTAFNASLQRYVLPQTERLVSVTWKSLPLLGIYKISRSAMIFGGNQNLPVQQVIIIRSWLLILIALIGLAAIVLLARQVLIRSGKLRRVNRRRPIVRKR